MFIVTEYVALKNDMLIKSNIISVFIIISVINPFKPNGISHSYQLDQSISVLRMFGL